MTREQLLAFLNRDWALARRLKDEGIGKWVRSRGTGAAFVLAQMLFDQTWKRRKHDVSDVRGLLQYREKMSRAAAARR